MEMKMTDTHKASRDPSTSFVFFKHDFGRGKN
jgi:hypothetical protein